MPAADYVIAWAAVAGGVVIGSLQYRRLGSHALRQVIGAPAGWLVRLNVFLLASGVWGLTNVPAVVAFPAAIIAWELTVRAIWLRTRTATRK
jgi:hypothetical protein